MLCEYINIGNYFNTCKTLIHNVMPVDGCIVIDNVVSKKQCNFLTLYDFLAVLFAALLLTDERHPVVSAAGQKSICQL